MGATTTESTEPAIDDPKPSQTEDGNTDQTPNDEPNASGSTDDGNGESGDGIKDKHGHPGISEGKYARDMKAKDAEIAELKAQIAKASETEESRADFEAKVKKLEEDQEAMKLDYELKLAGCVNPKAAKAILDDYDGDITKLKADAPYLFSEEKKKATGKKPEGSSSSSDSRLAEARKAAGIKKCKE